VATDDDHVIQAILDALTSADRPTGVAYLRLRPLAAGTPFPASPVPIVPQTTSHLAFVDPTPKANWGHDCRYLAIDVNTLVVTPHPARFPPFHLNGEREWRVAYRAPGLPDAFVHGLNAQRGMP
jgi:hypothetical protein